MAAWIALEVRSPSRRARCSARDRTSSSTAAAPCMSDAARTKRAVRPVARGPRAFNRPPPPSAEPRPLDAGRRDLRAGRPTSLRAIPCCGGPPEKVHAPPRGHLPPRGSAKQAYPSARGAVHDRRLLRRRRPGRGRLSRPRGGSYHGEAAAARARHDPCGRTLTVRVHRFNERTGTTGWRWPAESWGGCRTTAANGPRAFQNRQAVQARSGSVSAGG